MASLAIVPASGSVIAVVSACRITVSGATDTDITTYDPLDTPTEAHIPYRIVASLAGTDSLVSHEFDVSQTGDHVWDNVIFPTDGAWTVDLVDQRDDSVDATLAVTVTA